MQMFITNIFSHSDCSKGLNFQASDAIAHIEFRRAKQDAFISLMNEYTFSSVLILGINGDFGQSLALKLKEISGKISGIDLQERLAIEDQEISYISADVSNPDSNVVKAISIADLIVICTPLPIVLNVLGYIFEHVTNNETLIVDIASVKSPVKEKIEAVYVTSEYLSLHPMFGSDVDLKNQNLIVIPFNLGTQSEKFLLFLEQFGLCITFMEADDHDKRVAEIQVIGHFITLALARYLGASEYKLEELSVVLTPFYRKLLVPMLRMSNIPAHVYWQIQTDNPYSQAEREKVLEEITSLNSEISEGNWKLFSQSLASIQNSIETMSKDHESFDQ
ncbi:MAG: prephenate dehydrogenase/arogenate dehydrogenase family protein [Cyanobacteria bacterium J06648_10]